MDKEILTFGNIEIEKKFFFTFIRPLFFWEMWILIKLGSNCTFLALSRILPSRKMTIIICNCF